MTNTLIYDGDCGFCTRSVRFAERRIRPDCDITPWQGTDLAAIDVRQERAEYEVLWVRADGQVLGGVRAVSALLLSSRHWFWAPLGRVLALPPVRAVAGVVYRLIARNRHRMPGGTASCRVTSR
ncbi:DUF393 domain-containing protein [Streptomyces sp. A7024]|uniref:DUF393 domain-containing protein n=1 Tax=Streptomyces coryli TaxID=1128680 RepID=A0A6G4UA69_9ACTN|nr:DUF393 domain-containing protein [Streptomyces coryli]NGN68586.1 DUF393 domain-containing protein [Streptomyces coryli]